MLINLIIWLVVGGILGWLASLIMGDREGLLLDIVVGVLGAFVAGLILTPLVGVPTINQGNFSLPGLLISLLGSLILLAVVHLFRRRPLR